MTTKKVIVTTTINPPTEAILKYDSLEDWTLIVIGDLKTPKNYALRRGIYISPREQQRYDFHLSDAIGWNCLQRRNIGLLMAHDMHADIVALIDDDNIPLSNWGQDLLVDRTIEATHYGTGQIVFDPIFVTEHNQLWHRGFPLQLVSRRAIVTYGRGMITPRIQADFWNGDPDIDALCRSFDNSKREFDPTNFPFYSTAVSPFNSQNTFLSGDLLKDYFLCPGIGRMDDIWASYYLQAKLNGPTVVYNAPSVYHNRNSHDINKDLADEDIGYKHTFDLLKALSCDYRNICNFVPQRALIAWFHYKRHFELCPSNS